MIILLEKKSFTNCNKCRRYGCWAKNCHVPCEVILKNCVEQQVNAIEENENEECDEGNSS